MKIEAKELRIGNWLIGGNGKYFQVDGYGIMTISEERIAQEDVEPIILSPDILVKCGFERFGMADLGCFLGVRITEDLSLNFNNEKTIWIGEYDTNIQYLHQLQNLYYSLTNHELEINL